jgi:hypothetical protein
MRYLVRWLRLLGFAWATLVCLVVLTGIIGLFLSTDSLEEGVGRFTEIFNPLNMVGYIALLALSMPAIGAFVLAQYLGKNKKWF